jgi:hypothetical protein
MLDFIDKARERFPREYQYMKRLLATSWRFSRAITILYISVLIGCGAIPAFVIGKFIGTTNNIINVPPPTVASPPSPPTKIGDDISSLSDTELLNYAVKFAGTLRVFELNAKLGREQFYNSRSEGARTQNMNSVHELYAREETEFRNTFLHPAIQLRDEIVKRLQRKGVFIKIEHLVIVPGSSPVGIPLIAFEGTLNGPSPVADLADFLEQSARRL